MPPKGSSTKRKAPATSSPSNETVKKAKTSSSSKPGDALRQPHPLHEVAEQHGVVLRSFYPHEMSNGRARAYTEGTLEKPIDTLNTALKETAAARKKIAPGAAVVHWFKMDLRLKDNRALALAADKAHEAGVPLVGLFVVSPQDWEAHLAAPVRVDFTLRAVAALQADLAKLDIPLWIETVEKRRDVPKRVTGLMQDWGAHHLFANMEYEVDELRREAKLVRLGAEHGVAVEVLHDTCVVPPGRLTSGSGKQYAVYSPWFRAWVAHVHDNLDLIEMSEAPGKNPPCAREGKFGKLFDCPVPEAPESKRLSKDDAKRYRALWPAGEHEAERRLEKFCEERIEGYAEMRNIPSVTGTSSISVHLAAGTLSARTAVRMARAHNKTKKLDAGNEGVRVWISEVAWRDFYKHVLVGWPYVCMNKPFKPEYSNIEWSYDLDHFKAWQAGQTGYPIVDAAMRQVAATGWMHNRCRMIVASFLAKDLLLDWRLGERFFMEHLIDGDFASNNGGWGFSASVGVDPQPYFRVFNPTLQSEKFDPDGEYIRKWVPELKDVNGKAVHEPYARGVGAAVAKKGYPKPIVEHKGARERALREYKKGLDSGM